MTAFAGAPLSPAAAESRDVTYRIEKRRAIAAGIMETAWSTFLLLIAVKWFEAGATAKALIATGGGGGMLFSPLVTNLVSRMGWRPSHSASVLFFAAGGIFALSACIPTLPIFVAGAMLAQFCATGVIPLLTQIYQDNYPEHERGKLFSRTVVIRIIASAAFSQLAGWALDKRLDQFQWLIAIFACALIASGFFVWRVPSNPLPPAESKNPFSALGYAISDRLFGRTLISWMFMGFANLMMIPLRVEYLANPRFGLALGATVIAFLTGVLPNFARLAMNPVWGYLFDRLNFFLLRILINIGFIVGILAFFVGDSFTSLAVGALALGVANSGGDVAWTLWVTKLAPPERVADYMSVHTFLTGVRSIAAPFVAFYAIKSLSLAAVGSIAAGLILVACALLLPEIRVRARNPDAEPVSEDFTE